MGIALFRSDLHKPRPTIQLGTLRREVKRCWSAFERIRESLLGQLGREVLRLGHFHPDMSKGPPGAQNGAPNNCVPSKRCLAFAKPADSGVAKRGVANL